MLAKEVNPCGFAGDIQYKPDEAGKKHMETRCGNG